jgi:4'-phosphopantetheinyl transferase EntD
MEKGPMPSAAELGEMLRQAVAALTPGEVACAVQPIDGVHGLLPEEEACVANAVPRRRSEFAAGRRSARLALAALGGPVCPLLIGSLRQPLWPPGFAGSITHDGRYAAAIAWRVRDDAPALGIDLIDRADLSIFPTIASAISHPDEPACESESALARLFSAKETAVKILSPRLGRWLDLRALRARDADGGTISRCPKRRLSFAYGRCRPAASSCRSAWRWRHIRRLCNNIPDS